MSSEKDSKPKAGRPTKTVNQKFRKEYTDKFNFIIPSKKSVHHAFCSTCRVDISISHGGMCDIRRHVNTEGHKGNAETLGSNKRISDIFVKSNSDLDAKVTKAEVMFTNFIVEHNLPIAVADHAGQLFKNMFSDSEIAKKVSLLFNFFSD